MTTAYEEDNALKRKLALLKKEIEVTINKLSLENYYNNNADSVIAEYVIKKLEEFKANTPVINSIFIDTVLEYVIVDNNFEAVAEWCGGRVIDYEDVVDSKINKVIEIPHPEGPLLVYSESVVIKDRNKNVHAMNKSTFDILTKIVGCYVGY